MGYELTIEHPLAASEAAWVVLVVGCPVLFLLGRTRFEYEVFGRVSPSRWIAAAALVLLFPLLLHVASLLSATAVMVVLGAVAAADPRRATDPSNPAPL
nr:low temperature requirement protein A [Micromonospora antibiotica]